MDMNSVDWCSATGRQALVEKLNTNLGCYKVLSKVYGDPARETWEMTWAAFSQDQLFLLGIVVLCDEAVRANPEAAGIFQQIRTDVSRYLAGVIGIFEEGQYYMSPRVKQEFRDFCLAVLGSKPTQPQ